MVLTSSVSETEIGEPPHVAEADCVTDNGQEKVQFAAPFLPLWLVSGLRLAGLRGSQVSSLRVVKYVFELKQIFPPQSTGPLILIRPTSMFPSWPPLISVLISLACTSPPSDGPPSIIIS